MDDNPEEANVWRLELQLLDTVADAFNMRDTDCADTGQVLRDCIRHLQEALQR